jgi:aconitate hydratase
MHPASKDTFGIRKTLEVDGKKYTFFSLESAGASLGDVSELPFSAKILLENILRNEDGKRITSGYIETVAQCFRNRQSENEIAFYPARILMQDLTGVSVLADLAAMREAVKVFGGDPEKINPLLPVDMVIDHSVTTRESGSERAFKTNLEYEYEQNCERYAFLKWAESSFRNFRVVPPGMGGCNQINLEYFARVLRTCTNQETGETFVFPDSVLGTDPRTTMINALGVFGWAAGGIEAEATMFGEPLFVNVPEIVGFRLSGKLPQGATVTDLALTITRMLYKKGAAGKFVEFFGDGLETLTLSERSAIAEMAPEHGAACSYFPIDEETLNYLAFTGRDPHLIKLVEAYSKEQGIWHEKGMRAPLFDYTLELDLCSIEPSVAGPDKPHKLVAVKDVSTRFAEEKPYLRTGVPVEGADYEINHGDVVIAAVNGCASASDLSVITAAGLLARNAHENGLEVKPWVKTFLAQSSQAVKTYLEKSGLQKDLDTLGFNLAAYSGAKFTGDKGTLPDNILKAIDEGGLDVCSVLSKGYEDEEQVNILAKSTYIASPPMVIAYALAGSVRNDLINEPLGLSKKGSEVHLRDIWPDLKEVKQIIEENISPEIFHSSYADIFEGTEEWRDIKVESGSTYMWDEDSTYIKKPPYFDDMQLELPAPEEIKGARCLAYLGDSITTDHISPAGAISKTSPAGRYLIMQGEHPADFGSYGARRGNHEIMMRGMFADNRIRNELTPYLDGGFSRYIPLDERMFIFEVAKHYIKDGTPVIIIAGKDYGSGYSQDWPAKGTRLLGVRAVIAESFDSVHRLNLINMGVLPLQFMKTPGVSGEEIFDIARASKLKPGCEINMVAIGEGGNKIEIPLLCRIDTEEEMEYYRHGGILHYMLRKTYG